MKRLLPLLLIAAVCIFCDNATAQTATCQNLTVQLDAAGNYSFTTPLFPQVDANVATADGSTMNTAFWQSFTPTVDGILDRISVTFGTAPTAPILEIFDGQGTGGTLLHSQPIIGALVGVPTGLDIQTTLDLVASTEYTFAISDGGAFGIQRNNADPYAGGISSIGAGTDLRFTLEILQRPDVDNGSTDASGIDHWELSQSTFNCSNIGNNFVTLTVYNKLGNSNSCIATVAVEDDENPIANCQNISVDLDATGNVTILPSALNGGSTDNCPTFSFEATQTAFDCGDVGANVVTLTVEDPDGNEDDCSATVTVNDATPPTAICQNHTLTLDGTGSGSIVTGNINNGSSDNCAIDSYSLSQTAFNCANLGANTVTLTVEDVNGLISTCNATVTVVDNQTPIINCPSNIVICSSSASGETVTYAAPTGSDNCGFSIGQTDASGLTSGSTFPIGSTIQQWTITDVASNSANCSFTITVDPTPVAEFSTSPACQGEAIFFTDESTIDASSSIVSWSWNMDDGSGPITLVNPIHQYAALGDYDVELTVVSAEGCADSQTHTVTVTPVPVASFTFVEACEGTATAFTNTSTISAGTLSHSWDFGDGSPTSVDASPSHVYANNGTYTVTLTVTSDNGCEDVVTGSVEVLDSPTALFTATTACDGNATVFTNLSTGSGTLSHSWNFGDSNSSIATSPTHTYTSAGVYTVVLTVTNNNGCINTSTVPVTVNALPTVAFSFSDVCEGSTATFVNTSTAGSYNWDLGNGSSSTLTNPSEVYSTFGTYDVTLTVTDANFCINSATQQIEIFDLPDFTLTPTNVFCYGEATGQVNVIPQGTPVFPWTMSLNNGTPQLIGIFGSLPAGNYEVVTTDDNGCQFAVSTVVSQPAAPLGVSLGTITHILCNDDLSGAIQVTGTGGTSPYTYSIDGNTPQSTGSFSGLSAGTYDIQIVDDNLCVFDTTIALNEPSELILSVADVDNLLCNGDNSGSITVAATGGVTDYQFNLNGGGYDASSSFNGLAAGTYIIGVLDANGCTDTVHVTLTEPGVLQLSLINSSDALCFQQSNGSIEAAASSGTSPYQYSINGINFQPSGPFQGLSAGTYTVTVMDANGCLDDLTETIFEPSLLTIETSSVPVFCFGDETGEIGILAGGGTAGYEYSIDGGDNFAANGGSFSDLESGSYLAVVRDANGCTASEGVVISQPSAPLNLNANSTDALCLGDASGTVLLIATGGTPTYAYSDNNSTFGTSNSFGGFAMGTYTLYVKDLNGCTDSVTVNISQPSTAVSINNTLLSNPACPNQGSGTVTVQAGGGTPGYTYSSNGGNTYQSSQILGGLGGGNHLIFVKDANGCTDSDTVTLVSPPLLDLIIDSVVGVPCENNFTGEIHVTATGGTPSYNYFLNGGNLQTNGDYENLSSGTYTVSIWDVNGCQHAETIVVPTDQQLPAAAFSHQVSGNAVLFNNQSQFGNSYLWEFGDGSSSTEVSPVHVYAQPGDYEVTFTVTNECGSDVLVRTISTVTLGVEDDETNVLSLYPNPATTEIFVASSTTIASEVVMEVVSTTGQLIRSVQLTGLEADGRVRLDVSGLSSGIYYLRTIANEQLSVQRFNIIK